MKSLDVWSIGPLLVLLGACSAQSGGTPTTGSGIEPGGVSGTDPTSAMDPAAGGAAANGSEETPSGGAALPVGGNGVTSPVAETSGETGGDNAGMVNPTTDPTGMAGAEQTPGVPVPGVPVPGVPVPNAPELDPTAPPSDNFDLSRWKLTLPDLDDSSGNALEIGTGRLLEGYENDEWYFTDEATGALIFRAPNQAATTQNTSNVRSEFRQMLNPGGDPRESDNNWVLPTHPNTDDYAAIGGRLNATLAVDHVSLSGNDKKFVAGAVVVGQIHGEGKTEPLKIFYRKMPNHSHGSVFWNYEVRPRDQDDRYDISFDVWGDHTLTKEDSNPAEGVPLGAWFSYEVDVVGKLMKLEFRREDGAVKSFEINIADGHPDHDIDRGYGDDWFYFRAGAYNQCSTETEHPVWGAECSNNGIGAGDYAQVRFFALTLTHDRK